MDLDFKSVTTDLLFSGQNGSLERMSRILIIDDDINLRTVLGVALEEAGHEVVLAADGLEGIKKHRAVPMDVIVTDLFMPGQEGLETIKELRREFPDVKIIAMSGEVSANSMLKVASKFGADKILQKPFVVVELLKAIKDVL